MTFSLVVYDGTQNSAADTVQVKVVAPDPRLPGAPRNLGLTPGDGKITVFWDRPADLGYPPVDAYRVWYRDCGDTPDACNIDWIGGNSRVVWGVSTTSTVLRPPGQRPVLPVQGVGQQPHWPGHPPRGCAVRHAAAPGRPGAGPSGSPACRTTWR